MADATAPIPVDVAETLRKVLTAWALDLGMSALPRSIWVPKHVWDEVLNSRETDKRWEWHPEESRLFFLFGSRRIQIEVTYD